jgi:deazaflavin-dependent oxidoreductase (nitroreductase family)
MELKKGVRPVITHVGRSSGKTYHTPLDAHPVEGGYIFILVYGSKSDWVQNILASGTAQLKAGSSERKLDNPRVITADVAWELLPDTVKKPPGFLKIGEYLQMDVAS